MDAFKLIFGSKNPKFSEEFLSELTKEEINFVKIVANEDDLFKEIKRVQYPVVIINDEGDWQLSTIPSQIQNNNERACVLLLSEGVGIPSFKRVIKRSELVTLCHNTITRNKNRTLQKVN